MMLQQNLQTPWDGKRADNFLGILFHAYVSGATRLDHGLIHRRNTNIGWNYIDCYRRDQEEIEHTTWPLINPNAKEGYRTPFLVY
jgi:hypothetical protein